MERYTHYTTQWQNTTNRTRCLDWLTCGQDENGSALRNMSVRVEYIHMFSIGSKHWLWIEACCLCQSFIQRDVGLSFGLEDCDDLWIGCGLPALAIVRDGWTFCTLSFLFFHFPSFHSHFSFTAFFFFLWSCPVCMNWMNKSNFVSVIWQWNNM